MLNKNEAIIRSAILMACLLSSAALFAQGQTATGTINATLINKNGIALVFVTDPAGVSLGASGTSAASLNFGSVSGFGPLSPGVTRPVVGAASYTVRTIFDVFVITDGGNTNSYNLSVNLATAPSTGFSYRVDAVTLTTTGQTVQTNAAYNTAVPHNMDLVISTAAPGAGGPAVGTPISTTINFSATAN
jgi:hypothetical protein